MASSKQTLGADFIDHEAMHIFFGTALAIGAAGIVATLWGPPRRKAATLTADDRAVLESPQKHDGMALHQKVGMERWCVTPEDLRQFRRLVENGIAEGKIQPTDLDRFDPKDNKIGPCVHTVNSQLIMPVTKAAGGQSWALMKHPEGLRCDVFVTHGWAEGIYEFLDKVLKSWPRGAQSAYCCMLSNPQNLDISGMISSPSDSPFAKALGAASYMMVVPNAKGSIYTRVWCAYEAYLGYSTDKNIFTSSSPAPNFWFGVLRNLFVEIFSVGLAGFIAIGLHLAKVDRAAHVTQLFFVAVTPVCIILWWNLPSLRNVMKFGSLFGITGWFATSFLVNPLGQPGTIPTFCIMPVLAIVFAWSFEADTAMLAAAAIETEQLEKDFTGKLRDAKCSVPADGERIRSELAQSGSEADVNAAVDLLIHMGTFSKRLREVVRRTGTLGNVSRWNKTLLVSTLALGILVPMERFTLQVCQVTWLAYLAWAEFAVYILVILLQPREFVSFAVNCVQLFFPAIIVAVVTLVMDNRDLCMLEAAIAFYCGPVVVLFAGLGPANTARVPLVGPPLVRFLLRPKKKKFAKSSSDENENEGGPFPVPI